MSNAKGPKISALKFSLLANSVNSLASTELCTLSITSSVAERTEIFGLGILILWLKSITFLKICILVFRLGETFNAPSVMINGLSSFCNVICQIWLSLVFPINLYSLLRTSFINISVWICPFTIIFTLSSDASFVAIPAVLFSTGSLIISKFDISNLSSSAHSCIFCLSPINIGVINFSETASITDIIGNFLPAFTMAAFTPLFWWAIFSRLTGQTVDLSDNIWV